MKILLFGTIFIAIIVFLIIFSISCRKTRSFSDESTINMESISKKIEPKSVPLGKKLIIIEYIGIIDKPIQPIILGFKDLPSHFSIDWTKVGYAELSDSEIDRIYNMFVQEGFFKGNVETIHEFGAFRFTTVGSYGKKSFCTGRMDSIRLLENIKQLLSKNINASNLLKVTLTRIQGFQEVRDN